MVKSNIVCKTKDLKQFGIHDMFDEWRIIFFDHDLKIVDDNTLQSLKNELYNFLKSVSYKTDRSSVKLPSSFDLSVERGGIETIDQYNFPAEGETTVEYVEKTLGAILTFANSKDINVVACMDLEGIHIGQFISVFECAALVNGMPSCFECMIYQSDNGDTYDYVDADGKVWGTDWIVEFLQDNCIDNFAKAPYEQDDKGYLTDRGEKQREKVDKLIANAVFPSIYQI